MVDGVMIKLRLLAIGWLVSVCTAGFAADDSQGVLAKGVLSLYDKYGVRALVLKRKSTLRDAPPPGIDGFPVELPNRTGMPGLRVVLDLDYWVAVAWGKYDAPPAVYLLNPKDEQSSLVITINETDSTNSGEVPAKELGCTYHPGAIGNEKVVWRSWSDAGRLHSDCTAQLPAIDVQDGKKYGVILHVTANTLERRKALEDHLASLQLVFQPEEKTAKPNGGANGNPPPHSP